MSYIEDDFLLENTVARKLYYDFAKDMPIFDYHCHLNEYALYEDKVFENLYQVWLAGDHYKWRLMRNYGIDEEYVTGTRGEKEKFIAYVKALEGAFGNPLYHWSQMELRKYFNCDLELNRSNAEAIWETVNRYIRENRISPSKIVRQSGVKRIFTTNDISDDLKIFRKIREKFSDFVVAPAFRADKILNIDAEGYAGVVASVERLTFPICNIDDLEKATEARLNEFIEAGAVAGDIAVEKVPKVAPRERACRNFQKALNGGKLNDREAEEFKGYFISFLIGLFAKYNIVTEFHIGAKRNNNTEMLHRLGLDSGFDSISDENSIANLSALLDDLYSRNSLPKMIIYNLHPKMNGEIDTLLGCFQDGSAKGKLQHGAAWWFLDHKAGIENHLRDLSATGHIATFIGMLTDSRSFLSYTRHDYFRRILCNYLGGKVERGEITQYMKLVGSIVQDICYHNAVEYFYGVRERETL